MKRSLKIQRVKKIRRPPPGTSPGAIVVPHDALTLSIKIISYDPASIEEVEVKTASEIKKQIEGHPSQVHWIDIKGLNDKTFFEQLAETFDIHKLQMEDVVNVDQRPKVEEDEGHIFFVARILLEKEHCLVNEQLSLFLGKNYVISIQEKYEDIHEPVRNRIRLGKGNLRKCGADYLAYSLLDIVIDNYYPLLERAGDYLDDLQDELLANPTRDALNRVLQKKKDLILLRRIIWSERDKMNDILRTSFTEIKNETKVYFRDSYDHCIQLLDLVESYREVTASLMDVYHSSVSNRLNQVIKVLTIISTIFIPLTFIVGLYGMNFSYTDPVTGKILPMNMPELYSPYGYLIICIIMVVIVVAQLIFFYKKGWLKKG